MTHAPTDPSSQSRANPTDSGGRGRAGTAKSSAAPAADPLDEPSPQGQADEPEAPTLLMIVGSGRSGTSVLAGAMQRLGFHVPEPEVKADDSNPRGFGEPQWVVDFHNDLLPRLGVQVSDARPSAWTRSAEAAFRLEPRRMLRDWLAAEFATSRQLVV
jgi:hypothetical protein